VGIVGVWLALSGFPLRKPRGTIAFDTLRHILSHTSGLQNVPDTRVEIYPSPDFVQLALAAELKYPPGAKFEYNNKAVNLLAGVVERASGKKHDEFMRDEVFTPLGIREFSWQRLST